MKHLVSAGLVLGAVGLGGLGLGVATAAADPGAPCGGPHGAPCQPAPAAGPERGIEQARHDHQPFDYHGQRVVPLPAGNGDGWGFWFLGQWIRL